MGLSEVQRFKNIRGRLQRVPSLLIHAVLALLLLSATSAHSAIRVDNVISGLQGFARTERWVPITFYLRNTGSDFRGTLEINKGDARFRKSIDLAAQSTKKVDILVYYSAYYGLLEYRIQDEKGAELKKDRLQVTSLNAKDNLVLVLSAGDYNHQFLNGVPNPWGGKTFVSYLKPEQLYSEWIAYSAADAIVVASLPEEQVSSPQWKSILQYTASGGTLVCSSATDHAVLNHPMLREALPPISVEYSLISKGDFFPTAVQVPEFALPAQEIKLRASDTLLLQDSQDINLAVSSAYYKGNIVYFAFDYSRLPEPVRLEFASLWNDVLYPSSAGPPPFGMPFVQKLEENPRVQSFLYDIPGLRLPEEKWFALFFFLYICAIGPLQFLLLKVLKKTSFLWITFPLLILLFSLSSFGYSRMRQTGQRITQVTVQELFPGLQTQLTHQVYGTAMVQSGTFRFQAMPDTSYMSKFVQRSVTGMPEPYTLSEDVPRALVGETLKNWTFRTFEAVSMEPLSEPVSLEVKMEGSVLHGEIKNNTNAEISDAFFVYDSKNSTRPMNIEPGSTRQFSLTINDSTTIPFTEVHLRNLLNLYNLSYANPHFVVGEMKLKGEFLINGKSRRTDCLKYIAIFVQIQDGEPGKEWRTEKGMRKVLNAE